MAVHRPVFKSVMGPYLTEYGLISWGQRLLILHELAPLLMLFLHLVEKIALFFCSSKTRFYFKCPICLLLLQSHA